jgi:propionate kinase
VSYKIMAVNAGSSSLKFQLFTMPDECVVSKGLVERIGSEDAVFSIQVGDNKQKLQLAIKNHADAVTHLLELLVSQNSVASLDEIVGVGHRVAHGGESFKDSALIDEANLKTIEALSQLAPIHNPVNVVGIKAFINALPGVPQVAVFDTSYHQTMAPAAYLYPLPYRYYQKYAIRRYGFHGTSHKYVAQAAAKLMGRNEQGLRIISCHLGNGASVCAIKDGKSVNTSMGFTPLAGLMMGTRTGDIDPSILPYIEQVDGKTPQQITDLINTESGLLGVSGLSNDFRDIVNAADEGHERARLALTMFADRIRSTIGAYVTDLDGVDAVIFTAGIGENSSLIRSLVCAKLGFLGIHLDESKNAENQLFIEKAGSPVRVAVIPTNEELMIARDVVRLAQPNGGDGK